MIIANTADHHQGRTRLRSLRAFFGQPVSGTSLAVFRICFGAVNLYQTWEFARVRDLLYVGPNVHWNFHYLGFGWIQPFPEPWTTILFIATAVTSATLMLGLLTPISAIANGICFTYCWMMDATYWNNHYYLSSLFCLLLALMPAGRCLSFDWLLFHRRRGEPTPWSALIPFWPVFLLRAQLFIVYIYAAVVKLNPDWLAGEPMRMAFRKRLIGFPLIDMLPSNVVDQVFAVLSSEPAIYVVSWGGLVFDLLIGFLLCIRRTQVLGLVLILIFHGINFFIFRIGAFPIMAFTATLIFLDADWPIRFARWLRQPRFRAPDPWWMLVGMFIVPVAGAVLGWKIPPSRSSVATPARLASWGLTAFVLSWVASQALLPLRHFFIQGDSLWTEEGGRFAWQLMARSHAGLTRYRLQDPSWPSPDGRAFPEVNWPDFPEITSRPVIREVDALTVDLSTLPEFFVTQEPWIGQRVFYNSHVRGLKSMEEVRKRVEEVWQSTYGRKAAISPTHPLDHLLSAFLDSVKRAPSSEAGSLEIATFGAELLKQWKQVRGMNPEHPLFLENVLDLQARISPLAQASAARGMETALAVHLIQTRPFELQSARGLGCYQIIDSELREEPSAIRWRQWKLAATAFCDVTRFHEDLFRTLPWLQCAFDRTGQPVVIWNAEHDMARFPFTMHQVHPWMIHQYANERIATFWEGRTGHRPRVFVEAYVKLNQHPLQLLINPKVDLASVPLKIWSHNPWILPKRFRQEIYHERGEPRMRLFDGEKEWSGGQSSLRLEQF